MNPTVDAEAAAIVTQHLIDSGDLEDPLAGAEGHGGYWGFEVPEAE